MIVHLSMADAWNAAIMPFSSEAGFTLGDALTYDANTLSRDGAELASVAGAVSCNFGKGSAATPAVFFNGIFGLKVVIAPPAKGSLH